MSGKARNNASRSNQTTHFGIMGGLGPSVGTGQQFMLRRARNKQNIPSGPKAGKEYMIEHDILSKNPAGSGGVGKTSLLTSRVLGPCNCTPDPASDADATCSACLYDVNVGGTQCCDDAWYQHGITCSELETTYGFRCDGCNCPGDPPSPGPETPKPLPPGPEPLPPGPGPGPSPPIAPQVSYKCDLSSTICSRDPTGGGQYSSMDSCVASCSEAAKSIYALPNVTDMLPVQDKRAVQYTLAEFVAGDVTAFPSLFLARSVDDLRLWSLLAADYYESSTVPADVAAVNPWGTGADRQPWNMDDFGWASYDRTPNDGNSGGALKFRPNTNLVESDASAFQAADSMLQVDNDNGHTTGYAVGHCIMANKREQDTRGNFYPIPAIWDNTHWRPDASSGNQSTITIKYKQSTVDADVPTQCLIGFKGVGGGVDLGKHAHDWPDYFLYLPIGDNPGEVMTEVFTIHWDQTKEDTPWLWDVASEPNQLVRWNQTTFPKLTIPETFSGDSTSSTDPNTGLGLVSFMVPANDGTNGTTTLQIYSMQIEGFSATDDADGPLGVEAPEMWGCTAETQRCEKQFASAGGTLYGTLAACQEVCTQGTPPTPWKCDEAAGSCGAGVVGEDGNYHLKERCEVNCESVESYNCTSKELGECVSVAGTGGHYTTPSDCYAACTYAATCDAGTCTIDADGNWASEKMCTTLCPTDDKLYDPNLGTTDSPWSIREGLISGEGGNTPLANNLSPADCLVACENSVPRQDKCVWACDDTGLSSTSCHAADVTQPVLTEEEFQQCFTYAADVPPRTTNKSTCDPAAGTCTLDDAGNWASHNMCSTLCGFNPSLSDPGPGWEEKKGLDYSKPATYKSLYTGSPDTIVEPDKCLELCNDARGDTGQAPESCVWMCNHDNNTGCYIVPTTDTVEHDDASFQSCFTYGHTLEAPKTTKCEDPATETCVAGDEYTAEECKMNCTLNATCDPASETCTLDPDGNWPSRKMCDDLCPVTGFEPPDPAIWTPNVTWDKQFSKGAGCLDKPGCTAEECLQSVASYEGAEQYKYAVWQCGTSEYASNCMRTDVLHTLPYEGADGPRPDFQTCFTYGATNPAWTGKTRKCEDPATETCVAGDEYTEEECRMNCTLKTACDPTTFTCSLNPEGDWPSMNMCSDLCVNGIDPPEDKWVSALGKGDVSRKLSDDPSISDVACYQACLDGGETKCVWECGTGSNITECYGTDEFKTVTGPDFQNCFTYGATLADPGHDHYKCDTDLKTCTEAADGTLPLPQMCSELCKEGISTEEPAAHWQLGLGVPNVPGAYTYLAHGLGSSDDCYAKCQASGATKCVWGTRGCLKVNEGHNFAVKPIAPTGLWWYGADVEGGPPKYLCDTDAKTCTEDDVQGTLPLPQMCSELCKEGISTEEPAAHWQLGLGVPNVPGAYTYLAKGLGSSDDCYVKCQASGATKCVWGTRGCLKVNEGFEFADKPIAPTGLWWYGADVEGGPPKYRCDTDAKTCTEDDVQGTLPLPQMCSELCDKGISTEEPAAHWQLGLGVPNVPGAYTYLAKGLGSSDDCYAKCQANGASKCVWGTRGCLKVNEGHNFEVKPIAPTGLWWYGADVEGGPPKYLCDTDAKTCTEDDAQGTLPLPQMCSELCDKGISTEEPAAHWQLGLGVPNDPGAYTYLSTGLGSSADCYAKCQARGASKCVWGKRGCLEVNDGYNFEVKPIAPTGLWWYGADVEGGPPKYLCDTDAKTCTEDDVQGTLPLPQMCSELCDKGISTEEPAAHWQLGLGVHNTPGAYTYLSTGLGSSAECYAKCQADGASKCVWGKRGCLKVNEGFGFADKPIAPTGLWWYGADVEAPDETSHHQYHHQNQQQHHHHGQQHHHHQ